MNNDQHINIQPLLSSIGDISKLPLDGDDVDEIVLKLRIALNLFHGNITEDEAKQQQQNTRQTIYVEENVLNILDKAIFGDANYKKQFTKNFIVTHISTGEHLGVISDIKKFDLSEMGSKLGTIIAEHFTVSLSDLTLPSPTSYFHKLYTDDEIDIPIYIEEYGMNSFKLQRTWIY